MAEQLEVVIGEEATARAACASSGAEISRDYAGRTPVLVAVLKGSFVFLADLVRAITVPVNIDFMAITSYGAGKRGGVVRIEKDLDLAITGRDVLVVEDIVDTGLTLGYLVRNLQAREPAGIAVCTLLDRRARRLAKLPIRYTGFEVPDRFLVGYGLDQREKYRNLPLPRRPPRETETDPERAGAQPRTRRTAMIDFPADIRDALVPTYRGEVVYECVACAARHPIEKFAYTCPACGGLLSLRDLAFETLTERRAATSGSASSPTAALAREPLSLKGIFRFHELILPFVPPEDVVWLGEGHTPVVPANADLAAAVGRALLDQVRRPQPLGLLQGPRHGLRDLVPEPRDPPLGRARRARHLRLDRRHLGRRRALPRLPAEGDGEVRRAPARRQGHARSSSRSRSAAAPP